MAPAHKIIINSSKSKLAKLLVFSIIFFLIGLWILIKNPKENNSFFYSTIMKAIAGYGGVILGLSGMYFFTTKLFNKEPALIIDENGIYENTGVFHFGLIPWPDIQGVDELVIQTSITSHQRLIRIIVKDPESYISRIKSPIKRRLATANSSGYGSPVTISTNGLEITHPKLLEIIKLEFDKKLA